MVIFKGRNHELTYHLPILWRSDFWFNKIVLSLLLLALALEATARHFSSNYIQHIALEIWAHFLSTIVTVVLFAGFGGLFLFISYFYRSWLHLPEHAD